MYCVRVVVRFGFQFKTRQSVRKHEQFVKKLLQSGTIRLLIKIKLKETHLSMQTAPSTSMLSDETSGSKPPMLFDE